MGALTSRKATAVDPQHLKSRITQRVGIKNYCINVSSIHKFILTIDIRVS